MTGAKMFRIGVAVGFALVSLVGGCAAPTEADWYGDARFSEAERVEIQHGADWLYAQAGLPSPVIEWGLQVEGETPLKRSIRREMGPARAVGECADEALYLQLDGIPAVKSPPLSIAQLPGLAAHEMAHCVLGFTDRYQAGQEQSVGIMRVLSPMRWTESEELQCRASAVCAAHGAIGAEGPRP